MLKNKKSKHKKDISWEIILVLFLVWAYIVGKNYYATHPVNFINPILFFKSITTINFNLLFSYLTSLGALFLIHQSCLYVGRKMLNNLFKVNFFNFLEEYVFSCALGLVLFSCLTFFIGLLGGLYKPVFILLFSSITAISLLNIKQIHKNLFSFKSLVLSHNHFTDLIIKILFLAILLIIFLMAFVPDLYYDSLVYHASTANYWVFHHKIIPIHFNRFSFMPLSHSMLYIIGLLLNGEGMIKLINLYFIYLVICSLIAISQRLFNSIRIGLLAAVFFLSAPLVALHSWYGGNDLSLALMVSLTYYTLILSFYVDKKQQGKWFLLSAIFAGYASTIKYSVGFTLFPVPILIFWNLRIINKQKIFLSIKKPITYLFIVLLMMSPWLLRSWVLTGNPVYPFFSRWFNKDIAITHDITEGYNIFNVFLKNKTAIKVKQGDNIIKKTMKIILSPWNLSIKGIDSYRYIGPVLIFLLPFLFFIRKQGFIIFVLLAICISYLWFSFFTDKLKYYLPILPLAFLMASFIISALIEAFPLGINYAPLIIISIFTVTTINTVAQFAYQYFPLQFLTGSISKDRYLSANGPGYPNPSYAVFNYINKNLSESSKILIIGDAKTFYLKKDYIANTVHNIIPIIEWSNNSDNIDELYRRITEESITHILINLNESLRTRSYNINKWTDKGLKIFDQFWKKYIRSSYYANGVFLYKINSTSDQKYKTPINILAEIEKSNKSKNLLLKILTADEMWTGLIKEYENFMRRGYDVYLQLCYAYLKNGDYQNAVNIYKLAQAKGISTQKLEQMKNMVHLQLPNQNE